MYLVKDKIYLNIISLKVQRPSWKGLVDDGLFRLYSIQLYQEGFV